MTRRLWCRCRTETIESSFRHPPTAFGKTLSCTDTGLIRFEGEVIPVVIRLGSQPVLLMNREPAMRDRPNELCPTRGMQMFRDGMRQLEPRKVRRILHGSPRSRRHLGRHVVWRDHVVRKHTDRCPLSATVSWESQLGRSSACASVMGARMELILPPKRLARRLVSSRLVRPTERVSVPLRRGRGRGQCSSPAQRSAG